MNYLSTKRIQFKSNFSLLFLIITILIFFSNSILSQYRQQKNNPPDKTAHQESKEGEYYPDLRESQQRSPAYNYSMNSIVTVQVNVDASGQNIVGDAANEPSIAINFNDKNIMAIGWRQFNTISSSFRQAGYGYTTNGGANWTFPGVIEPGVFRSDPVLDSDAEGNFYYNSLTNSPTFFCDVFKSSTGGATWDSKVYAQGGDKQWMTIDLTNGPGKGHIYSFWTSSFSVCSPGFFTRSTDNGASFEDCVVIPNDPYWGTLTVGLNSELYIGGSIGFDFLVAKSLNAKDSSQVVAWDMTTVVNLDGNINFGVGPNPGGLLGQTNIGVDTSGGPYNGNVYLLCSVERNSNSDPLDVMFARSTDGGVSWSSPVRVNDDIGTTAYQWFGTMSVAPNGRIDVVWLDTRDNPGTVLSSLYYSNSTDGGVTWSQNERLSGFFDPHVGWPQQQKMGDYFDMISDAGGAYLAWAATFNGEQDVYFSHIIDTTIVPVELTSLTANVNDDIVTLEWTTATEINNHGFEIERSFDQSNWRTIAFKEGKGTTSQPQQYSFSDDISDVSAHKLLYRLKQVDFNGSYEYSNIIELDVVPKSFSLSQNYPNPFNPITTIEYGIKEKSDVVITILNSIGEKVAVLVNETKEPGHHTVTFNAEQLPSGIYFYQLKANNFVETNKMILLK